jgi:Phage integrase, N-terminal SAM-like domain
MQADLKIRNHANSTQRQYIQRVAHMAQHFNRSPDTLDREEVRSDLLDLKDQGISRTRFIQTMAALRFFYRVTLGRPEMVPSLPYPRHKRRDPVVLTADQRSDVPSGARYRQRPNGDQCAPREGGQGPTGGPAGRIAGDAACVLPCVPAIVVAVLWRQARAAAHDPDDPARGHRSR